MKILIDARLYGLENAGLGRYINNLVDKIQKIDRKNQYVILLRKKYYDSLDLPENWKKVLADFRHYSFKEQILLPQIINNEKPDLVHFPHFNVPILFNGKFIVTIHDLLMHRQKGLSATTLPAPFYFLKRLAYKFVFNFAIRKSIKIIVPSQTIKNELVKYYRISELRIVITNEGVDDKILSDNGVLTPKPYFVYTGNAYPHKNLKRLIQAIVSLNKNVDQKVNLIISSARNNFTQKVEKLISALGGGDYVKMVGFVSDSSLGYLYKNSVGFVFPSVSEGFGLPGLEALKSGTILLASEIPVFKEIYKENAVYFNPFDFSSIEKAMKNVLSMDEEERKKMVESGIAFVKRYSWDKMAEETLKIYENEGGNSLRQGK